VSHLDVDTGPFGDPEHDPDRYDDDLDEPRRRRRGRGCLPVLLALVIVAGIVFLGGRWVVDQVGSRLGDAPDYPGPGSGSVLYQVKAGSTATAIGRELKAAGVVKSVDAFTSAASDDDKSRNIQVGYYPLKKQMKAAAALAVLVDPANLLQARVVVPEGARVRNIVKTIVAKTDITRRALTTALSDPASIGLPAEAKGNPEGYLFPATYSVPPGETAVVLLKQMVAKTAEVQQELDLKAKAAALGYTPEQVLTVASILEYEANRSVDYPKVARVLYNRLAKGMPLQLDSTVAYVSGRSGDVWTTSAERADSSAYNTYAHAGLPPGPIGSPGEETIKAALSPAKGSWLFFLPDFQHGTTLYYDQDGPKRQADLTRIKNYCLQTQKC
jgi:UPF0755 protein